MTKETKTICYCNSCENYPICLAQEKEQDKLIEEICSDGKNASITTGLILILIGIFLGYFWHYMAVKDIISKQNTQIKEYKIAYERIKIPKKCRQSKNAEKKIIGKQNVLRGN